MTTKKYLTSSGFLAPIVQRTRLLPPASLFQTLCLQNGSAKVETLSKIQNTFREKILSFLLLIDYLILIRTSFFQSFGQNQRKTPVFSLSGILKSLKVVEHPVDSVIANNKKSCWHSSSSFFQNAYS
ncbi:MAG: hypothetical protein IPM52_14160 [Bacteroidetes bacterium]|nr:hypothetical protein [Bacteroidota bacterium]